jgi:hypothetical protein
MNVIDRKQASEMLNVSIRTIDRYIQRGILNKEEINGRIFIKTQELKPLLDKKKIAEEYLSSVSSLNKRRAPETAGSRTGEESTTANPTDSENNFSEIHSTGTQDDRIYKNLYEESQNELKNKQERLEGANYRVGQLEGLLKESIPLIEYRKALGAEEQKRDELEDLLKTFEKDNEILNQTIDSKKTELEQVARKLEMEKFNKKVFVIILIILFLLQPLWLLFPPGVV